MIVLFGLLLASSVWAQTGGLGSGQQAGLSPYGMTGIVQSGPDGVYVVVPDSNGGVRGVSPGQMNDDFARQQSQGSELARQGVGSGGVVPFEAPAQVPQQPAPEAQQAIPQGYSEAQMAGQTSQGLTCNCNCPVCGSMPNQMQGQVDQEDQRQQGETASPAPSPS
jgi:hypothetical protein